MSAATSLSLFAPPESPTLPDLYALHWSHLRAKGTRACDLESLDLFDELHPGLAAEKLTFDHCRKVRRELDARVKAGLMSQNTANKRGRHLNRFLKLLGPNDGSVDQEDPNALQPLGILSAPLRIAVPPRQQMEIDDWIEIEESGTFLAAAARAKWLSPVSGKPLEQPPRLAAPAWWTAAWLLIYNSALRIEEAILSRRDDLQRPDKWGAWLHVRREVGKTGERMVYLNAPALAAVEQLAGCGSELLLGWEMSHSFLDRLRREIYQDAGLVRLLEMEIGWHGLRKACATELTTLGGEEVAMRHLGHKAKSTLGKHYLHRSAVCKHVDQLPQPTVALLPPQATRDDSRQLKLFD